MECMPCHPHKEFRSSKSVKGFFKRKNIKIKCACPLIMLRRARLYVINKEASYRGSPMFIIFLFLMLQIDNCNSYNNCVELFQITRMHLFTLLYE